MPIQINEDDAFVAAFCSAIENERGAIAVISGGESHGALQFVNHRKLLADLANACLWASVSPEEGRLVRGAVCLSASDQPLTRNRRLSAALDLSVVNVKALLTASPRRAVGAEIQGAQVRLWGYCAERQLKGCSIRLVAPGILSASIGSRLIAVIEREQCLRPADAHGLTWPYIVSNVAKRQALAGGLAYGIRVQRVVAAMTEHRHGGTIVVVPANDRSWENLLTIPNRFDEASADAIPTLVKDTERAMREAADIQRTMMHGWKDAAVPWNALLKSRAADSNDQLLQSDLEALGQMTAVDGALVLGDDLRTHGFGAKLLATAPSDTQVTTLDALTGIVTRGSLDELGGTRHQSAARFVHVHRDSIAFVASQDGRLTLFVWVESESCVVALRRLEYLVTLHEG